MQFTPAKLEEKLVKFANEADKLGLEYADLQAKANIIIDRKDDFLAAITQKTDGSSHAEKERNARLIPEWATYQHGLSEAKNEALKSKIKYDTAKRNWETARSLLSSLNTQRRTYT